MKPISKKIITASVCLMAAGAVLTGIGFAFGGRPGVSISRSGISSQTSKREVCELEKTKIDSFTGVDIKIDSYADIQILPSGDDNCYLEYLLDGSYGKPQYKVSSSKFTMSQPNKSRGVFLAFTTIGDYSLKTFINLYVPEDKVLEYMEMCNDSGDITIKHIDFNEAAIQADYGDVTLQDSSIIDLSLEMDSGDLNMNNTETQTFTLTNEYGENILKNFSCKTADVVLDSSDFYMDAAEIETFSCYSEYGDITLLLPETFDTYSFNLATEYGYINLPSDAPDGFHKNLDDGGESYQSHGTGTKTIEATADSGDIEIRKR